MTSLQGSFSVPAPFKALVTITCSTLALSHPLGVAVIFFSTFLSPLNYQLQTLSICGTINTKNERCANVLILKIFIIYAVVTILVFLKNTYRKYHVNYLRNTYRENLLNNQNAKNYELLIPFTNVFEHAHMSDYRYDLEDYIIKENILINLKTYLIRHSITIHTMLSIVFRGFSEYLCQE